MFCFLLTKQLDGRPLGPFVPAPPEVAMRLWREQGGGGPFPAGGYDDSFEAEGGNSRANRNRSGPMTGVGLIDTPPMILPLPNAHHDPRRIMRRYFFIFSLFVYAVKTFCFDTLTHIF